ncbi:MAG: HEAT repeat domain-containing protein [Bacteroidetes bacterium]|nr:HEAT repeat domain-containing protein [Bacteroidota bacterium]
MHKKNIRSFLLTLLAIVFSIALMFAFIEIPALLNSLLEQKVGFPGFDHGADANSAYMTDVYIDALYLRWIGYTCLGLVIVFIILGFMTRKTGWAWAGAFTLFLPVFGQFALSMFFLSGLGILRAGWFPFMDISWDTLNLGRVIYLPYDIIMQIGFLAGWNAHFFIAWALMAAGSFLFTWGVLVWFKARFQGGGIATNRIYKISRHPQYLGWILWSYGLMLYASNLNDMKKSWGVGSSLPWLLMTMIIIAICLLEERKMSQQYGDAYDRYRSETPFLFPLPKLIKSIILAPFRLLHRKSFPQSKLEILSFTGFYTIFLITVSAIWIGFERTPLEKLPDGNTEAINIDSIVNEIQRPGIKRRDIAKLFDYLDLAGKQSENVLIDLIHNPEPAIREFSAQSLGHIKSVKSIPYLTELLKDDQSRVVTGAIIALGEIGHRECFDPLIERLTDPKFRGFKGHIFNALANIGHSDALPYLIEGLGETNWYTRVAALSAIHKIEPKESYPYVYQSLTDEHPRVRREAVLILLKDKPSDASTHLEKLLNDEDFETRFYARIALRTIH